MIRVIEEKPKCHFGHCEHPPEDHHEGTCWHIVKPELKDQPTNRKYCDCKQHDDELIKSFSDIEKYEGKGWMEPDACPKCFRDEDKTPTGYVFVKIDPKSKIGTPKECSYCFGKGTIDSMITMECESCKRLALIRTDIKLCTKCDDRQQRPVNFFTGVEIEKGIEDAKTRAIAAQKLFDIEEEKRVAKNKALFKKHNI